MASELKSAPLGPDPAYVLDRLSRIEVLRALPPDEVQAIVPDVELVHVPEGRTVVTQGEVGDGVYLIENGRALVRRDDSTDLAELGPGDVFGEMALVHDVERTATVTAATPLTLWRLPADDFQRVVQTSPHLAAALQNVAERRRAGLPIQAPSRRAWLAAAISAWALRGLGLAGLRAAEERLAAAIQRKREHRDVNLIHDESLTIGQKVADRIAVIMGSWPFIIGQSMILLAWVFLNVTELLFKAWDPYPFILMNLILSLQAAYAAPVIMMSQNRQSAKDRLQAELDLRTNLHAETLIEELHGAMEDLRLRQWQELLELQERQLEALDALMKDRERRSD
jgi:uncharacterized membrane protein